MKILLSHLKTRIFLPLALFVAVVGFTGAAVPAYAASNCPQGQQEVSIAIDQAGTKCVPINAKSSNLQENPIFFYLRNILLFVAGGVGLAVVGGIVAGSYMYITARANAAQVQKGQETIINSVIGLLLFIFMYAILQFLIPGGIFG
jgi:hypothetical protein